MIFSTIRKSAFFPVLFTCVLPVLTATAQPDDAALTDPVLESTPLPNYKYVPGGKEAQDSWLVRMRGEQAGQTVSPETLKNRQKVEELLRSNPDMPAYMKRAYRAWLQTGDKNIHRFAQAASEFQKQELREQLVQHIDDPEKLNRMISVLYGKPNAPYRAVGQSGYAINQETGEIVRGNDALSRAYDRKLAAQANRQNARKRETSRSRTYREDRSGNPLHSMKQDYLGARKRAAAANRPDLVEELDRAAARNSLLD